MQKRLEKKDCLLNPDGSLKHVGYCESPVLRYNREDIQKKSRIKEWDYYLVMDSDFALCLTISNLSFAGVLSASVVDLKKGKHYNKSAVVPFAKDKVKLALSPESGTCEFETKQASFKFVSKEGIRHLVGFYKNFYKDKENRDLEFDILLDGAGHDMMVKTTPFKKKQHFYYNVKQNCMKASGFFTFFGRKHEFVKSNASGTFDFGRGVLPYKSMWYWASMSAVRHDGTTFGFNLGRAFGDNSAATENMIFVNGKAEKVEDVKIYIQRKKYGNNYMGTWTFYSSDGKVELMFEPIVDRYAPFYAVFLAFLPHQVFGRYTGKITLDSGEVVNIEDMLGFSERVTNLW